MPTTKERQVKALVYVRKTWVEGLGTENLFKTVYQNEDATILIIPVAKLDVSDPYFVEIVFYPRMLEDDDVKSIKALVPKHEVLFVLEPPSSATISTLGFKYAP
jgi:hypothetical protein